MKVIWLGLIAFVVVFGLIAAMNYASSEELPQGMYGEKHEQFHDFYKSLWNPAKKLSCCHDKDCRPTRAKRVFDHYEVLRNAEWVRVDDESILKDFAPDGGAHICSNDVQSVGGSYTQPTNASQIYCVILPPEW
jgi:hypothetical protein